MNTFNVKIIFLLFLFSFGGSALSFAQSQFQGFEIGGGLDRIRSWDETCWEFNTYRDYEDNSSLWGSDGPEAFEGDNFAYSGVQGGWDNDNPEGTMNSVMTKPFTAEAGDNFWFDFYAATNRPKGEGSKAEARVYLQNLTTDTKTQVSPTTWDVKNETGNQWKKYSVNNFTIPSDGNYRIQIQANTGPSIRLGIDAISSNAPINGSIINVEPDLIKVSGPDTSESPCGETFKFAIQVSDTTWDPSYYNFYVNGENVQQGGSDTLTISSLKTHDKVWGSVVYDTLDCPLIFKTNPHITGECPKYVYLDSLSNYEFCEGKPQSFDIYFSTSGTFTPPTDFTAQLSPKKDFSAGIIEIGSDTTSPTIDGYISDTLNPGKYYIRIKEENSDIYSSQIDSLRVFPSPVADAGPDGDTCGFQYGLSAVPSIGTGVWSKVSGPGIASFSDSNSSDALVTVDSVGTYLFSWTEVTNQGCIDRDTVQITFTELPQITAGIGGDTCGYVYNLESGMSNGTGSWSVYSGPGNATFSPDAGDTAVQVTVDTYGRYVFEWRVEDSGCVATDTVGVHFYGPPVTDAEADEAICKGDSVTLTATGGLNYTWSNGSMGSSVTVSPPVDTSYTVTVTDAHGCTAVDTAQVTVHSPPPADANDRRMCRGDSITLTATGGTNYAWSTGDNIATTTVSPSVDTAYMVTVTDANGCKAVDTARVIVDSLPEVDLGNLRSTCIGDTVILDAGAGYSSYQWSDMSTGRYKQITSRGNYEFSVTVTDGNGCTGSDTVEVTIDTALAIDIGGDQEICQGDSVKLSVDPYYNEYLWSTGDTTSSITVAQEGDYSVTVTENEWCKGQDQMHLTVNPLPVADAGTNQSVCKGDSVSLGGSPTATGGTGSYQYTWSPSLGNESNPEVTPTQTTNYHLTVTDAKGCTDTSSAKITVHPLPVADAGSDFTIGPCASSTGMLDGSQSTGNGLRYAWSPATGLSDTNTVAPEVDITSTTTYTLTVTDVNGCQDEDQVTVNVAPPPPHDFLDDRGHICNINETTLKGPDGYSYQWSTGETTQSIMISDTGDYKLTITDSYGCQSSDSIHISETIAIDTNLIMKKPWCPETNDGSITIEVKNDYGEFDFKWSTGDTDNTIEDLGVGRYMVTITDPYGCVIKDTFDLGPLREECVEVPNVFTPNDDGHNDVWKIPGINRFYPKADVYIYDRWGQLLYVQEDGYNDPWDGRYQNKKLPIDSYHYIIFFDDSSDFEQGSVTIVY